MTAYDGTAEFVEVSSDKLGQTVVWKGTALPVGAANKIPQFGFFQNITTGVTFRQTSATMSSPAWSYVPTGATADFSEYYTTNTGWTQTSTLITVDSGTADKCDYAAATDGSDRKVYKSLGFTLDASNWSLESVINITAFAAGAAAHFVYVLAAGTGDPATSSQDMLAVSFDTYNDGTDSGFCIAYKDGAGSLTYGKKIGAGVGTYYIRFERYGASCAILKVFRDYDRTDLIGCVSMGIPSTVGSLTTLMHANNSTGGVGNSLTCTIDNTRIADGENGRITYE